MKKNALYFLIALFCSFYNANAQKKFKLKVVLDSCMKIENFEFKYNNGVELRTIKLIQKEGTFFIEGEYLSKYATIELLEKIDKNSSYITKFWVDNESAILQFKNCDKNGKPDTRKEYKLENAISLQPFDRNFYLSMKDEYSDLNNFYDLLRSKFDNGDSTVFTSTENKKIISSKNLKVLEKNLEYIKLHKNEYYSFYKFREIVPSIGGISVDSLNNIFNIFPDEFKNSFEGEKVLKSIFVKAHKVGSMALNFQSKDINDKVIALSDYHGKYVMLNFWETTCRPCIEEIPEIKKIREKYPLSKLEIISISQGKEQLKLLAFIKKNKMDWTQIVNDVELINDFAVQAIPKTVLIDDNGKIIHIVEGNDLKELKGLLKERLLK